ncbi:MAG: hypothetical protein A2Y07_06885 [Planctomycetes bacterium GWF2_50_10]|nr:MAG: hypothetical protein A2Y07_06885 [Planctomycetes bacterium GWF2_50_10]
MIAFGKIKTMFFDKAAVISATDKATRKVLSKFGAFVRTTAQHSIKKRKQSAHAGSPPSSHTGFLKKFIFFGYDTTSISVVIGPAKLNTGTDAPETLEHGGTAKIGRKRKRIVARPFMGPAFKKEQNKLPAIWRDSIRR